MRRKRLIIWHVQAYLNLDDGQVLLIDVLCVVVTDGISGARGSANKTPITCWAGEGVTTTKTEQLWELVRV